MSYRGFKRLLGESGLERKCRMLLGAGVISLMSISFYVYGSQTQNLAYEQLEHTGRALVTQVLAERHANTDARQSLKEYREQLELGWNDQWKGYKYRILTLHAEKPEQQAASDDDLKALNEFRTYPNLPDYTRELRDEKAFLYYGPIKAGKLCVDCHASAEQMKPNAAMPNLAVGDLMAVAAIRISAESLESGFHKNRALLIAFAIGTTILIMAGSYLIIRYVIVKPVKHLKDVADAIATGELNVRSEIQTGDEFEDLSQAFNRMLRNLLAVQDRNKGLITDLDRKLDELARLNLALYESNKLKGDFLSTMSHELRTPLNSILGFSENLLTAENLTDKQHRWAGNIMTGGQQLLALINDILDLAKTESGKMRLYPAMVPVPELVESATALFRPQAEKKNIDLRVDVTNDFTPVRQDAGKLRQIISNLVSNAVKFTPAGGRVTVRAHVDDDKLVLAVTDTGVGIDPSELELIFEKFRQSSNSLTREHGGTGLGLSIVRELAKLLGGDVAAKSELGRGSTFTVTVARELKDDPKKGFELPDEVTPGV